MITALPRNNLTVRYKPSKFILHTSELLCCRRSYLVQPGPLFFMGKFSSQEIESQYILIKMLLADPEKYKDAMEAIKKDSNYMPLELKKKLEEENITL